MKKELEEIKKVRTIMPRNDEGKNLKLMSDLALLICKEKSLEQKKN